MGRASGAVPLPGCSPAPGTRCTQPARQVTSRPGPVPLFWVQDNPTWGSYETGPFRWAQLKVPPPQKSSTNSCCPQGQSPEAMGMSHGTVGMSHASTGRAPSLPTIHRYPQERREKQGSRAEIHRNTSTPITPPAHGEQQGARRTFLPWVHVLFGGGHPQHGLPSPISLQRLFVSPQGCAAQAPRPPHPQPWKCPPCSDDSSLCCSHTHRALPFPHSAAENRQTGKPRHGKGGGSRGTRNTCAINSVLWSVEKEIKDLAGITTSIPNTRMLESPRCRQLHPRVVSY